MIEVSENVTAQALQKLR